MTRHAPKATTRAHCDTRASTLSSVRDQGRATAVNVKNRTETSSAKTRRVNISWNGISSNHPVTSSRRNSSTSSQ
eukprot:scaffold30904_cov88-Phaeocystis_antarctica.AAC.4